MATPEELRALIDERRNGCNSYIRHPLARKFVYTDGIKEVADLCGAHWLLDIIGTEAVPVLLKRFQQNYSPVALVHIQAKDSKAGIWMDDEDDAPALWKKHIGYTDFPEGVYVFKLGVDSTLVKGEMVCVMCLLSED